MGWVVCAIVATPMLVAGLLALFLPARQRSLTRLPRPGVVLVPATIVDHWWAANPAGLSVPSLSVVEYPDEHGRLRYVRHLYQQQTQAIGIMGQVQFDRGRPDRVLRFRVGRLPSEGLPARTRFPGTACEQDAPHAYCDHHD